MVSSMINFLRNEKKTDGYIYIQNKKKNENQEEDTTTNKPKKKKKHREDEKNKIFFSIQANFQVNSKGNYLVDRSDTMNSL